MFTAALITTAKIWKQPKCPSTDEWIMYFLVFVVVTAVLSLCLFIHFSFDIRNTMNIQFYFVFWKFCYVLGICFLFSMKS